MLRLLFSNERTLTPPFTSLRPHNRLWPSHRLRPYGALRPAVRPFDPPVYRSGVDCDTPG